MESCLLSSVTYYSGKNKTLTTAFHLFKNNLYFYFFASEKNAKLKTKECVCYTLQRWDSTHSKTIPKN